MRKVLWGLLAVALLAVGAVQAAQNLRQNEDGTADWIGSDGSSASPVGAVHLQMLIPNIVANVTFYTVSPVSNAKIVDARLTRTGTMGATNRTIINFFAGLNATPVSIDSRPGTSANRNTSDMIINVSNNNNVTTFAVTAASVLTDRRLLHNSVSLGDVIRVEIRGQDQGQVGATHASGHLIIVIQPK